MDITQFKKAVMHAKVTLKVNQHGNNERVQHCIDMCDRMLEHYQSGHHEKAMRWLGFVQGFMWAKGFANIDDMKKVNSHLKVD